MLEQGPDFWCWFDTTQFSYHCVHPIHAKMFSIQMSISQIVPRVCTLVLFIIILLVGCKNRANEGVFYIGGRGFVCQIIEPFTFARCTFIFALRNITLGRYLDTRRNI